MGVYIKGMKIPKTCEDCLLCNQYETVTMIACGCLVNMRTRELGCVTRPDWCPIMEVPDHGRLIDADALINNLFEELKYCRENGYVSQIKRETIVRLCITPTVIPASWEG